MHKYVVRYCSMMGKLTVNCAWRSDVEGILSPAGGDETWVAIFAAAESARGVSRGKLATMVDVLEGLGDPKHAGQNGENRGDYDEQTRRLSDCPGYVS